MKFIERNIDPICPHCEEKITEIIQLKGGEWFQYRKIIYCCSNCHKVLGVSPVV